MSIKLTINVILFILFLILGFKIAEKILKIILFLLAVCAVINILTVGGIL